MYSWGVFICTAALYLWFFFLPIFLPIWPFLTCKKTAAKKDWSSHSLPHPVLFIVLICFWMCCTVSIWIRIHFELGFFFFFFIPAKRSCQTNYLIYVTCYFKHRKGIQEFQSIFPGTEEIVYFYLRWWTTGSFLQMRACDWLLLWTAVKNAHIWVQPNYILWSPVTGLIQSQPLISLAEHCSTC